MAIHDSKSERLFVEADLTSGADVVLSADQSHYLLNVLRTKLGDRVLVFNGRQGEWQSELIDAKKKAAKLQIKTQTRPQTNGPDIHYAFAPLKRGRIDYIVQKATELGVAAITPVMTRYTVAERVNIDRMRANVIEAAEQCGVLRVPTVSEPVRLSAYLDSLPMDRALLFCDENADIANPVTALQGIAVDAFSVLIGPEGGFSDDERAAILGRDNVVRLSLGPRVMRADTAGVAALALLNAVKGDWQGP